MMNVAYNVKLNNTRHFIFTDSQNNIWSTLRIYTNKIRQPDIWHFKRQIDLSTATGREIGAEKRNNQVNVIEHVKTSSYVYPCHYQQDREKHSAEMQIYNNTLIQILKHSCAHLIFTSFTNNKKTSLRTDASFPFLLKLLVECAFCKVWENKFMN